MPEKASKPCLPSLRLHHPHEQLVEALAIAGMQMWNDDSFRLFARNENRVFRLSSPETVARRLNDGACSG